MAECANGCGRPVPDTAYVEPTCARQLAQALTDAAELVPELETALARQTRFSEPGPRPRNAAPAESIRLGLLADPATDHSSGPAGGLPFSEATSIDIGAIRNLVSTWCRIAAGERGVQPPAQQHGPLCRDAARVWPVTGCWHLSCSTVRGDGPMGLGGAMRWLSQQLDWARYQRWAAEAWQNLECAAELVARAVDRPAQRRYLGPCGEPDGLAGACPGELYAHPQASTARCRECGIGHSVAERKDWLDGLVREHTYTAAEIADAYRHVRADRIRQWASRGQIAQHGTDRRGHPLYKLAEVLELATRHAARKVPA